MKLIKKCESCKKILFIGKRSWRGSIRIDSYPCNCTKSVEEKNSLFAVFVEKLRRK